MRLFYYLTIILLLVRCSKEANSDNRPDLGFIAPDNFPAIQYNFNENPFSREKRELGRKLFYDTRLSRDNSISCGNCHQQAAAFSHAGHRVSHGIDNQLGTRNAPSLFNLAWQPLFFWDGGVGDLDLFHINPIQNPIEMDETVPNVLIKLRADLHYPELFKNAFGDTAITPLRFYRALSIFLISLVSNQSRYDEYINGNPSALTSSEKEGLDIFNRKCSTCHSGILFTDFSFRNNGLSTTADLGRFRVSVIPSDSFKFKVPSLRNVEKSAPYMHDGRFFTLEEVMDHYSDGVVQTNTTLDPLLQMSNKPGIPLTPDEKGKLIAFLKTLTDIKFITDSRFSEE